MFFCPPSYDECLTFINNALGVHQNGPEIFLDIFLSAYIFRTLKVVFPIYRATQKAIPFLPNTRSASRRWRFRTVVRCRVPASPHIVGTGGSDHRSRISLTFTRKQAKEPKKEPMTRIRHRHLLPIGAAWRIRTTNLEPSHK